MTGTATLAPARPRIELFGIAVDAMTERECVEHVLLALAAGQGGVLVTLNLDFLRRLLRDAAFRTICARATLTLLDGMPLIWGSRLQRTPVPGRVAGSNLIWSLPAAAAAAGRSVFLFGGAPGTAARAAAILQERNPTLRIAGTSCPPLGFERDPAAVAGALAEIQGARPDIVFVALGLPKQEVLIDRWRSALPAAWWLGVGISFSFVAGDVVRAPRWMQRSGLEWLHRLWQEPKRLARRYLLQGIPFAACFLARCAWRGLRGRRRP